MRGKVYDTDTPVGRMLFAEIQERMPRAIRSPDMVAEDEDVPRYGLALAKHRLGQGGFRVVVTDTYQGRCAITGEKTLPVLEAAHIQPYAANGPHLITNGILVKSDFHTLFDSGYITVSPDYRIEVSHRLHEDFGNGKIYYQYHGQMLHLPEDPAMRPAPQFLNYHNEKIYLG